MRPLVLRRPSGGAGGASGEALAQIYLVRGPEGVGGTSLAADLRRNPDVLFAEPNYVGRLESAPPQAARRTVRPARQASGKGTDTFDDPFLTSSGSWGQDFQDLWGLYRIDAPSAWPLSQGEGVVVAVIDTGVDIEHPDLVANVWRNEGEVEANGVDDDGNGFIDDVAGWDFSVCERRDGGGVNCLTPKEPGPDVTDVVGHGTMVAGIVAAVGGNGIGIVGVAPKAKVMSVKAFDTTGVSSVAEVSAALLYAAANGARVINASWSFPPSETLRTAINYVTQELDAVVIAAAGNGPRPLEQGIEPANIPSVISVGATTHLDEPSPFSNFGGGLDLVAPGGGETGPETIDYPEFSVLSLRARDSIAGLVCYTRPCGDKGEYCDICEDAPWVVGESYLRLRGSSLATAYVSGVAALVRAKHPTFTRREVKQILLETAEDLGEVGWDATFGYGRVNALRALQVDGTPVAEITAPENRGKVRERELPIEIRGTVLAPHGNLQSWELRLRRKEEPGSGSVTIAQGSSVVVEGVLGTLSSTTEPRLEPGRWYILELEVHDSGGRAATDHKTFLIPDLLYAVVPIPDPFDEGGQGVSLSTDGSRMAFSRSSRSYGIWMHDARLPELRKIDRGGGAVLSGDGTRILYWRDNLDGVSYDIDDGIGTETALSWPISVYWPSLTEDGQLLTFISDHDLVDPTPHIDEPRTWDLFLFQVPGGPLQQLTFVKDNIIGTFEVSDTSISTDGARIVFTSTADLDPEASTNGLPQAFIYDFSTTSIRQLSGISGLPRQCTTVSIDAAANTVACQAGGIYIIDSQTRTAIEAVGSEMSPGAARLSADGTLLAFGAAADLDPTVLNEDLRTESFLLDRKSGIVRQISDTLDSFAAASQMDSLGDTLVTESVGRIGGTEISISMARFVRRKRTANRNPFLSVAASFVAPVGRRTVIYITASDPDGDRLFFHVQRLPLIPRLGEELHTIFTDQADGTAALELTPEPGLEGTYPLLFAVFDEEGGMTIAEPLLTVSEPVCTGDCNRDGEVTVNELVLSVDIALNLRPLVACESIDDDASREAEVDELLRAVLVAIDGCDP